MRRRLKTNIYSSTRHVVVTVIAAGLPFLFFLFVSWYAHVARWTLMFDFISSFYRIVIAYCIAVVIAWLLAVLFYRGMRSKIALPIFDVLQSFPTFAALPIAAYILGASNITIIIFLVITIIWPILFSIVSSLKLIRQDWNEAVSIYNVRGLSYIVWFLIPITLPGLITGSIIGLGEGWEALIATEMIVGTPKGLGSFFQTFSHDLNVTALGICGFLLVIFVINKFVWLSLLEWSHKRMEL
jgi:ABC-type nitrate/sulfonate/bicarbonate transport system permease component